VAEASRLASPGAETHRRPDHGAIVDLTHALGLRAVGEGVERAGQREVLRALGCDVAHGLYFGRPQPPEVAEALAGRSPRY